MVHLVQVPSQVSCVSISLCLQTITDVLDGSNLCLSGKMFGRFERRGKRPSYQSILLLKKGGGSCLLLMKTCSREDGSVKTLLEGLLKHLESNSSSYRNKIQLQTSFLSCIDHPLTQLLAKSSKQTKKLPPSLTNQASVHSPK